MSRRAARKTLFRTGRRGDSVRVLVDENRDRVEVLYRDSAGIKRKRTFDNTKDGKAEAKAWAETYHSERKDIDARRAAPKPISNLELWGAYVASPDYAALRPKTKMAYSQRFGAWMNIMGSASLPNDVTLLTVDGFIAKTRAAGKAINQIRQILNVARIVYRWGQTRKLVQTNELTLFRWKQPKDAAEMEPPEYDYETEYLKLLDAVSPQDGRTWRAHVALMIAGHHGQRANAIIHLRWDDVDLEEGVIVWPAAYQKGGKDLMQPLTWEAISALRTAQEWRNRAAYTGPWVLFGGGGNKKLGQIIRTAPARRRNEFTRKTTRSYRRERSPDQDVPVTYGGLWVALRNAERRAGVKHIAHRLLHGMRKMNAGNVADVTGDARLGMEWIGDVDPKQMKRYLKTRSVRMSRASDAASPAMVTSNASGTGGELPNA